MIKLTPEQNQPANRADWECGISILNSMPQTVFVELTRRCNMYCTCCRPAILSDHALDMSDAVLEEIEKELFPTAKVIDFRGWGESTLDDRLPNLIERWSHKGKSLFLYTNCQTKSPAYWEALFRQDIHVLISLRSARKESYEGFMRGASFQRLISHLEKIPKNNQVYFTVVLGDDNIFELEEIANLAMRYNIKHIHLNPLSCRPNPEDYPQLGVRKENRAVLHAQLQRLEDICNQAGIRVEVCADLFSRNQHTLKRCVHPWSYAYIAFDGRVGFCDHLMCVEDAMMGNIMDGFAKIWNNAKYQELRQRHAAKSTQNMFCGHIECQWCYENRYGNWEHLIVPGNKAFSLHEYLSMRLWE